MPIQVKSADAASKKWAARAGAASADYAAGVANPRVPWATATAAAANTWATGVQTAVANGQFAKGVGNAGNKWSTNAAGKGAQRYPQGVSQGTPSYMAKITPVLQVIAGVTLPPRAPKGDPSNLNRVSAIDTALRAAKVAGTI